MVRRLPARHDRPLRRAALRAVLDDRSGARASTPRPTTSSATSTCCTPSPTSTATSTWSSSGTMGEYGTPNIDIEEGWLDGRAQRPARPRALSEAAGVLLPPVQGPRQPQHRVRLPDLGAAGHRSQPGRRLRRRRPTQTKLDPRLATRFDYDGVFGTVLNRIVIQAVLGHPLTVYGNGGQTRGLINIVDTVECIRLASENPGRPRASSGCSTSSPSRCRCGRSPRRSPRSIPGEVTIEHVDNPRVEAEDHYYNAKHTGAASTSAWSRTLLSTTPDRPSVRRRRAPPGPGRPRRDHADRQLAGHYQRAARRPPARWRQT